MKKHLNKHVLIITALIVALVVIYGIYRDYRPEISLLFDLTPHNQVILLHLIRSHGLATMVLLLLLIAIFNAIPGMSNSVICIFAGLCYGPWVGFLINWLGNILGNCAVMSLIREVDISKRTKKSKILTYLLHQKHPLIGLTIGYMIPVIPSALVNYAGARLNLSRGRFLTTVAIGMAPTSFIYAFGGDAIFRGDSKRLIGAVVAIVVILLGYVVVRKIVDRSKVAHEAA